MSVYRIATCDANVRLDRFKFENTNKAADVTTLFLKVIIHCRVPLLLEMQSGTVPLHLA